MLFTDEKILPEFVFIGKKFIRREDLTDSIRSYIAVTGYLAKTNSRYGIITNLARQFDVSRTFVYDAISSLEEVLAIIFNKPSSAINSIDEKKALRHILSLRLEGRCSISAISTVMKRFKSSNNSEGFISQALNNIGSLLPDTLINRDENVRLVVFASDEIFSKTTPILVTVDPVSSAILKIELSDTRKAKDWVNHWNCIEDNGHTAICLVSDEGTGLTSGHSKGLTGVDWQPDTFHAISHRLGIWVDRFEKSAYQVMEEEYKILKTIKSAKSEPVISKRTKSYQVAIKESIKKVELYEEFKYLYKGIVKELNVFDCNGDLRERERSEENIKIYLDLIDTLENKKLSATINKIRKTMPDLLNYFDNAPTIVENLKLSVFDEDTLKALCAGWQWHKRYIKSKKAEYRKYCRENESFCLEIAEGYLQEEYEALKEQVYNDLNNIVQSSAMVECINSIIRPYLNTSRNQTSQEMLNLIMFYHNHRLYNNGERAKKSPYEILSGKKQKKDWMELLFDIIDADNVPTGHGEISLSHSFCLDDENHHTFVCHGSSDDYALCVKVSR